MGKVIRLDNKLNLTVTGILKDLPPNTDRKQEIYISYGSMDTYTDKRRELNWGGVYSGCQGFTLLKPNVSVAQANNALAMLVKKTLYRKGFKGMAFLLTTAVGYSL